MTSTTIRFTDSEAHSKLLMLLDRTELQIGNPAVTAADAGTVRTAGTGTLFNHKAQTTLTETKSYGTKSLELTMETTGTGTLADMSDWLSLNPYYRDLYRLLEFSNMRLYARASEGYDFEYLTLEGDLLDDDTLLGLIAKQTGVKKRLTGLRLAVHISHRKGSYKKNIRAAIKAKLALGDQELNVELSLPLADSGLWHLRLLPPGVSFNIASLVQLGMTTEAYDRLPLEVKDIPDFVLNSLSIDFDPSPSSARHLHHIGIVLGVGHKEAKPWVALGTADKPIIALRNIGLSLDMSWDHQGHLSYKGWVNGTAIINGFEVEATVPIPLKGIMTLEARSTKALPSLTAFTQGLIGSDSLGDHLPEGEMSGFDLYLDKLRLAIDLDRQEVQEFGLSLKSSTDGSWKIWEKNLELTAFSFDVLLLKQNSQWLTSGTLYGKGRIRETGVAVLIEKPAAGPWEIALAEPVRFGLGDVAALTETDLEENKDNALPAEIIAPDAEGRGIVLRKFRVQLQKETPRVPYLGFYVETGGELPLFPGKLALRNVFFILELRSSAGNQRTTAVQVGGTILIGSHPIALVAKKTDEAKGWEYQGKTEPGDLLSLNDLLDTLLKPADVNLPANLPQLAVLNLDLYYAPKLKQVSFKGSARIRLTEKVSARFTVKVDTENGDDKAGRYVAINGTGHIDIYDASFVVSAAYDSRNHDGWAFAGRAYDPIVLTDLFRQLFSDTAPALPEALPVSLTLRKAKFESTPQLKYYKLTGSTELKVAIARFTLDVALDLDLERPAAESPDAPAGKLQIEFNAGAHLRIAEKADLLLSGNYSTDRKGWLFNGVLSFEKGLTFAALISGVSQKFGTEISLPKILDKKIPLTRAGASLDTAAQVFTFDADLAFTIYKYDVTITALLTLTRNKNETYDTRFWGQVALGKKDDPLLFDLIFDRNTDKTWMLATYAHAAGKKEVDLGVLLSRDAKPIGITIDVHRVLLAYHPSGEADVPSKALFLIDIGNGIDLSNLPLVGHFFPSDKTLRLSYQVQYATQEFTDEIKDINDLLKAHTRAHPLSAKELKKGFDLAVNLQIGETIIPIDLNLGLKKPKQDPDDDDAADDHTTEQKKKNDDILEPKDEHKDVLEGGLTKWFSIQKTLGSLYFSRIGIGYKDGKLLFMLDASISAGGLTIAMAGLTVSSPLTEVKPSFGLDGLGIDFKSDVFEIGGSFLRKHVDEEGSEGYNEYDGLAVIKFKAAPANAASAADYAEKSYDYANEESPWSISAIGSYAHVNGHPSLFIYAALNYPIGGPSFFFVTGLSAGFGYNRKLVIPKLGKVLEFPLLAETLQGKSMPANADRELLLEELQVLHQYIPPAGGQVFLAVGISFTTYKLVESSLLLAASFGNRFELNLLGVSSMTVPSIPKEDIEEEEKDKKEKKEPTRLADVKLLLKGSFIPSEGFVGIQGVIGKKSYILSKDCKLSGGFAFFAWFNGEHKGDFVATVGGYHAHFNVPAHYPKVPRLGFSWKLGESMLIKGDAYFALCAHALMAGGHLEATYESGALKAWFKMGADFLVAWQPYHYEARIYVDIGCSYTFEICGTHHITIDVGADVSLWGPESGGGGHAVVHLWIFSIGVDFGAPETSKPTPLSWNEFAASFLPATGHCNITVSNGLVSEGSDPHHLGVVNPKDLCLVTDAFIPSKTVHCDAPVEGEWNTGFGIGSMDLAGDQLQSHQVITIEKTGDPGFRPEAHFSFTALTKKVPAGLWGTKLKPEVNDPQFIDDAFSGLRIQPKTGTIPGAGTTVRKDFVRFETWSIPGAIAWEKGVVFPVSTGKDGRAIINGEIVKKNNERAALLQSLGLDYTIDLSDTLGHDLMMEPVVIEMNQE